MQYLTIGLIVIIAIWNALNTYYLYKINQKNTLFFDDGSKNLRSHLETIVKDYKKIAQRNENIETTLLEISKIIENSYQRMSLVRYNPFADTGGDLSFSLALLDLADTGFVITGIHGRGVDRIYAKEIIKGKSKHNLSEEEIAAIRKAHDEK